MSAALLSFFIVLLAGLIFSELFNRFHLPWVLALIVAGVVIGPQSLAIIDIDPTLEFIGEIGLVFLMFMAGLEAKLSSFSGLKKEIVITTIFNALIPFILGISVALLFGYQLSTAILLGVIFISSSIAVVIPSLQRSGYINTRAGKLTLDVTLVQDILSLIFLSIIIQTTNSLSSIPLYILYPLLLIIFIGLRWIARHVSKLVHFLFEDDKTSRGSHELQVVLVMLIGSVVAFQILGLHPIVGAFLAGLILSDSIKGVELRNKLRAIGYGLFVPIFFVLVGVKTDILAFTRVGGALSLTAVIVAFSMSSKFIGGWIGARLSGLSNYDASFLGVATIPQLSTTLAVAYSGLEFGILDETLVSALVVLSAVTTFIGPFLINQFTKDIESDKILVHENR
jgi:Kef-type K+ transport system membrane component KefB